MGSRLELNGVHDIYVRVTKSATFKRFLESRSISLVTRDFALADFFRIEVLAL